MEILKLTVNKKWFDMINSGIKNEELRELKPYWISRLCEKLPKSVLVGGDFIDNHTGQNYNFKEFDAVEFTNGYSRLSPKILVACEGIRIYNDYNMSTGGELMVDETGTKQYCFIISLGSKLL